jgi:hypothetical protein
MAAFGNDEFGRDRSRCSVAAPQGAAPAPSLTARPQRAERTHLDWRVSVMCLTMVLLKRQ